MSKNFLTGRSKELEDLSKRFEEALERHTQFYEDADNLADLADWYAMRHKKEKAFLVTDYGLTLHPNNTELLVEKAYLYFDNDEVEKAKEVAQSINDNYMAEVHVLRATLLYDEGREEEAEVEINAIVEKNDLVNIIDVAYLYLDKNLPEKAWQWIERNEKDFADEESFIALKGNYYYQIQDYDKAKECYNTLIDRNPYVAENWVDLGRVYLDEGNHEKALECAEYAIVSDEEIADAYFLRGNALLDAGKTLQAIKDLETCVDLGMVENYYVEAMKGQNFVNNSEWEQGCKALKKVIDAKRPEEFPMAGVYCNYGLCLSFVGRQEEAHFYCQLAREEDPGFVFTYMIEGRIYLEEGKEKEAIALWAVALELGDEHKIEIWYEIGTCCLDTGHLGYALTAFEQCYAIEPTYNDTTGLLSLICLLLGKKEKYNFYIAQTVNPQKIRHTDWKLLSHHFEDQENLLDLIKNA